MFNGDVLCQALLEQGRTILVRLVYATFPRPPLLLLQWRIQICKMEGTYGERADREPKRGSGADPSRVQGQTAPGGGSWGEAPLRLKAF